MNRGRGGGGDTIKSSGNAERINKVTGEGTTGRSKSGVTVTSVERLYVQIDTMRGRT